MNSYYYIISIIINIKLTCIICIKNEFDLDLMTKVKPFEMVICQLFII